MLNVFKEKYGKILLVAGMITACAGIPGTALALTCVDCHGNPPVDNASRVGGTVGQFPGSHGTHTGSGAGQYGYACTKCHVNNTATNHANGNIDMAVPINGNTGAAYGKGTSFAVSNNALAGQACSATYCHSDGTSVSTGVAPSGASPNWGASTTCTSCHGGGGTTGAPSYVTVRALPSAAPVSTGWTNPGNAYSDDNTYAVYNTTTQQPLVLTGFNMTGAGLLAGDTITGISVTVHGLAASGLINVALTKTANATIAGTAKTATLPTTDGWVTINTTLNDLWGTTWSPADLQSANFGVIVKDNDTTASNIQIDCVTVVVYTAADPKLNSHASHATKGCEICHNATTTTGTSITNAANHVAGSYNLAPASGTTFTYTYNATGSSCSTVSCHGGSAAAIWGVTKLGCVGCHSFSFTRTKGRPGATLSAVSTEFGLAWGHKNATRKSAGNGVTDADCIVCHLEGSAATGKASAYHQDGNIDLRDPDGNGEVAITNVSGAAFTFQRFSTSYAATARTSTGNTANTIDNVVTQKFCLACHDSNGATNTTARSGVSPTQYLPFGTGSQNAAATYPVPISAGVAGGVFDAKSQFATTNSSYHPVMGPKTKDFPTPARLYAPYNNFTRAGTSGTKTAGVVINCMDCHNIVGSTPLTLRTVVAHGNAVTLRGGIRAAGTSMSANLCINCHQAPTTSTGYLSSGFHGTGSAYLTGNSNMNSTTMSNCYYCHGTATAGASVTGTTQVRPIRAVEVHGFNDRTQGTVGSKWTNSTFSHRPYAFIRNSLSYWSPKSVSTAGESVQRAGGCTGTGGTCNTNMSSTSSYTTGGTY